MNQFLRDILDQPAALAAVTDHLSGPGRSGLAAAAQLLRSSQRIVVSSMGSALFSAEPLAWALSRWHPGVHLVETAELLREHGHPASTHVLVSRSGESGEIAALAPLIRQRGGRLLAITMTPDSTLARHADVVLHDPASFDGLICTKAFTSLLLTGLLADAQAREALDQRMVSALHQLFTWMRDSADALSRQIASHPAMDADGLGFLAHGVGMTVARAGHLWTEEAARVRCDVQSLGMFNHGPLESVDAEFAAVVIDLATHPASRQHRRTLASKGARLLVIADAVDADVAVVLPGTDLPEGFLTIPAALPVQLIAYHLARMRGLEPGVFRHVGWVVT